MFDCSLDKLFSICKMQRDLDVAGMQLRATRLVEQQQTIKTTAINAVHIYINTYTSNLIFVWQRISVLLQHDRQSFAVQGDQALQWELSQRTERSKEKKKTLVISTFIVIS